MVGSNSKSHIIRHYNLFSNWVNVWQRRKILFIFHPYSLFVSGTKINKLNLLLDTEKELASFYTFLHIMVSRTEVVVVVVNDSERTSLPLE